MTSHHPGHSIMTESKLTDAELAEVLGLDSADELISTANKPAHAGSNDTMFIQTHAGVWLCLNSPGSRWEFRQDEQWDE